MKSRSQVFPKRCSAKCFSRRLRFETLEPRQMLAAFDVLVFSKTAGFRHDSIDEGVAAIQALGAAHDFSVVHTENAALFTAASLATYEAVVFLNTTGDVLNAAQQAAFENYIRAGGGYAGVHSAADTEHGWAWYGQLLGAYFASHPAIQQATIKVADHAHSSTAHLPDRWVRTDEWYNYSLNPRGDVHVLATLDESTYTGGAQGFDHPISWYKYFEGGRSWYTGLGHTAGTYAEPLFLDHLLGGIQFAAGQSPADLGATIDANWQKVELSTGLNNPVSLAIAPSGEVYFVELGGRVKIYNPSSGLTTVAANLSVFAQGEDGLLAIALDPDFAENRWIYLYYSPAGPTHVNRVSRFTLNGGTLDLGSERVLLTIPTNRVQFGQQDGHSGGSLAFGPGGVLYISTGDDTVPFESDGYTPIDERVGRERFDAQRASANTNDLRGKILRIKPEVDGSYSIPAGNLFTADATHRPEIYVMGCRNPYRISIDPATGWLYWGDIGPDASNDAANRGPRGYDEINQAREAGNYGWPYSIADNKAYIDYNFATGVSGPAFDPDAPENASPNNTGAPNLPSAESALVWYPYATSSEFPELGTGGRTAMMGPVYQFDPALSSDTKLPEYFDETPIMYDWSRNRFWELKLDENGAILKINPIFSGLSFARPIDAELGPDGALYVLEWGTGFGGNNADAKLVRVEFVGNLPGLFGDYNLNGAVDASDFVVWRSTLGDTVTPFAGADGDGNGTIDQDDYGVWTAHFGQTLGAGSGERGAESMGATALAEPYSSQPPALPGVSSAAQGKPVETFA
ncbi:MAG TPA: ThuA domain-containing protein, partial [Pirellulales bacterium]|nr:ThuA domain-containing protein [Pirellulales bacterium]